MSEVYNLPTELLSTLKYRQEDGLQQAVEEKPKLVEEAPTLGPQACSVCRLTFASSEDQKIHARSDVHHYNVRLKVRGQSPISETEFETLMESKSWLFFDTLLWVHLTDRIKSWMRAYQDLMTLIQILNMNNPRTHHLKF